MCVQILSDLTFKCMLFLFAFFGNKLMLKVFFCIYLYCHYVLCKDGNEYQFKYSSIRSFFRSSNRLLGRFLTNFPSFKIPKILHIILLCQLTWHSIVLCKSSLLTEAIKMYIFVKNKCTGDSNVRSKRGIPDSYWINSADLFSLNHSL